jgi:hypothetical protein
MVLNVITSQLGKTWETPMQLNKAIVTAISLFALSTNATPTSANPKIGQHCELQDDVLLFFNKADLVESGDENSISRLLMQRKVITIPVRSTVMVLECAEPFDRVRVETGEDKGRIGWLFTQELVLPKTSQMSCAICKLAIGESGELVDSQDGYVLAFVSENAYASEQNRAVISAMSNYDLNTMKPSPKMRQADKQAEAELIKNGICIRLPNYTSVMVLEKGGPNWTARKVRIITGPDKGQTWWVTMSALRKPSPSPRSKLKSQVKRTVGANSPSVIVNSLKPIPAKPLSRDISHRLARPPIVDEQASTTELQAALDAMPDIPVSAMPTQPIPQTQIQPTYGVLPNSIPNGTPSIGYQSQSQLVSSSRLQPQPAMWENPNVRSHEAYVQWRQRIFQKTDSYIRGAWPIDSNHMGTALVAVTIYPNRTLILKVLSTNIPDMAQVICGAYRQLDGDPLLDFPSGTKGQVQLINVSYSLLKELNGELVLYPRLPSVEPTSPRRPLPEGLRKDLEQAIIGKSDKRYLQVPGAIKLTDYHYHLNGADPSTLYGDTDQTWSNWHTGLRGVVRSAAYAVFWKHHQTEGKCVVKVRFTPQRHCEASIQLSSGNPEFDKCVLEIWRQCDGNSNLAYPKQSTRGSFAESIIIANPDRYPDLL